MMAVLIVSGCEANEPPKFARRHPQSFQRVVSASATDQDKHSNLPTSKVDSTYLAKPVRLETDGNPIDMAKHSSAAHAAPWIADVDGDGDRDLLVGDLSGDFWFFKNQTDDSDPQYTLQGKLQFGGVDSKTSVYSGIASSPQFVDYDHDGILDLISGSWYPGEVYLFRNLGDGKYAEAKTILDQDGQPLVHEFGSWPTTVDWDADGDLDILIGNYQGALFLRSNIGTREEPEYSRVSSPILAEGIRLKESGYANPVIADWDGDGKWDLLIGTSDGSVGWYRNIGSQSKPEFGLRNLLVKPAAENMMPEQNLKPYEDPLPGVRAQICVTDYNGDGLQDLIVGAYSDIIWTEPLSKEGRAEFEELKQQQVEIVRLLLDAPVHIGRRGVNRRLTNVHAAGYQELHEKLAELEDRKKKLFVKNQQASYVWLYLRKSGAEGNTGEAK